MTLGDVARVLAKAAAFDSRSIGEADVAAWFDVIGRLDYADCLEAVRLHYSEQTTRIMPADVKKLAVGIRDQRESKQRTLERRLAIEAGPTTADRSDEVTALVHSVVDSLPKADIQERAVQRARQERGRKLPETKSKQKRDFGEGLEYPDPATADAAALARAYLRDGYTPAEVSERLAISKRWCVRASAAAKPPIEDVKDHRETS